MCTLLKQLNLFSLEFGSCRLVLAGLPEPHRLCKGRMSAEIFCSINSSEKSCSTTPQCHWSTSWHWAGFYSDTSSLYKEGREDSVTTCLGTKWELFLLLMPAEDMCIHSAIADLGAALFTWFFCPTPVEPIFLFLDSLALFLLTLTQTLHKSDYFQSLCSAKPWWGSAPSSGGWLTFHLRCGAGTAHPSPRAELQRPSLSFVTLQAVVLICSPLLLSWWDRLPRINMSLHLSALYTPELTPQLCCQRWCPTVWRWGIVDSLCGMPVLRAWRGCFAEQERKIQVSHLFGSHCLSNNSRCSQNSRGQLA